MYILLYILRLQGKQKEVQTMTKPEAVRFLETLLHGGDVVEKISYWLGGKYNVVRYIQYSDNLYCVSEEDDRLTYIYNSNNDTVLYKEV